MKKVLLLFPNFSLPQHVLDFALQLARAQDVVLHGLFINSLTPVSRESYPFPNDIDTLDTDFTKETDEEESILLETSLVKVFEDYCTGAGVKFFVRKIHEKQLDTLTDSSEFADLVVLSEGTEADMFSLKNFLTATRCPAILVPPDYQKIEQVIFAYDDHFPGMHALKMFSYLLPAFRHLPTVFVSVVPSDVLDIEYREEISSWLQHHFPQVSLEILQGAVKEVLPQFINRFSNVLVVMGAYGRSGLSLLFKESMASVVTNQTQSSVFIAHN